MSGVTPRFTGGKNAFEYLIATLVELQHQLNNSQTIYNEQRHSSSTKLSNLERALTWSVLESVVTAASN